MSAIRKLTGMGGDVRQIAKLLQAKAPPGHKLAFISEEEAALLKSRGGSGRITPEGIPSYEETFQEPLLTAEQGATIPTAPQGATTAGGGEAPLTVEQGATAPTLPAPGTDSFTPATGVPTAGYASTTGKASPIEEGGYVAPNVTSSPAFQDLYPAGSTAPGQATLYGTSGGAVAVPEPTIPQKPSFLDKTLDYLGQPKTLAALGIGGAQAALGANAVRKAQQDAAAAKQQLQTMAAPYQQQGQQLQQLANQGQLTPANQQTLQAARAQLAQGAEARGGVGAAQAANQIATLTQSLLANQMNMGIQLQGVGDKIAQGAIQTGIQADQYINQLTSSYAQNIARTVAGAVGLPGQTQTTTTVQQS